MASGWRDSSVLVLAMLLFGSYNTVNNKLILQTVCPSLPTSPGELVGHHVFNKPWFINMMMFMGESLVLIPHMLRRRSKANKGLDATLLDRRKAPFYLFALPASFDVLGTGIAAVGMMFIDAAVWQMMRGAVIVFSAILSVTFLRRKLRLYHWIGVLLTVVGLCIIGVSAILALENPAGGKTARSGSHAALGIFLTLLAQMFSAFQFVFEEYLLTGYSVASLETVGKEGVWGIAYMTVILTVMTFIPGSDHGVYQSLPDGLFMIRENSFMLFLVLSFTMCIAIYNSFGMQVCRKLSAVTRCLVDCMRTAVVWGFQLFVYYFVSKEYGQPWNQYSWVQLIGFLLLVLGTFIYNGVISLPMQDYRRRRGSSPQRVLQSTWSPTVNRAAIFGWGPKYGPQSPHGPNSPQDSPLPGPFGMADSPSSPPSPSDGGDVGDAHEAVIILEGVEGLPHPPRDVPKVSSAS